MHSMSVRRLIPVAFILTAAAMLSTQSALAHERRAVDNYSLVVGFNNEPALQGQPNGMQLTVTVPSEGNRPVEGLADTLKTSVAFGGGQPKEFPLRAQFGVPGRYVADFIPTRPGTYIFTFSGSIEGNPINERFESGPGRFNDVDAIDQLQFPEAVPPANDVARAARVADDRAAAAADAAAGARSLAIGGVVVGVVGILVGAVALGLVVTRRPEEAAVTDTPRV
jgi:hypothetical protein